MEKSCDTCTKKDTCKKDIGNMFGFCNIDYEPITKIKNISQEAMTTCKSVNFMKEGFIMAKTKEAYRGIINGQKIYFVFGLSGFDMARKMASDLNINIPLKCVRVSTNKFLIGEY